MIRVAFDVGGTFTDVVAVTSNGAIRSLKIANSATSAGTARGVAAFASGVAGGDVDYDWRHASTIASNAVIEGNGPLVALVTTAGFRDSLEIRDLARPNVFDVRWQRTSPLVGRELRLTIDESMRVRGGSVREPHKAKLATLAEQLRAADVQCVAIALVNSYLDGRHEQIVADYLAEHCPGLMITTSHDLSGEIGEYERMSTAAVNAYLLPVMDSHLGALEEELPDVAGLLVMQSGGGAADMAEARHRPVRFLESGPAAGVVASSAFCARLDLPIVVALDMGGTTVKACVIENGQAAVRDRAEVGDDNGLGSQRGRAAGYPVRTPCFDIAELGAGGGSIASVDRGLLHVGPRSAGAVPGPACYDRGGTNPTVTDANVALGLLNPFALAAGTFPIRREFADQALARLAEALACPPVEAAWGVRRLANATMVRAIRSVTIERGRDPRECVLLTSGGSGALHAAHLAEAMGISRVVVPPFAGVLSALGLLIAPTRSEQAQTVRPVVLPGSPGELLNVSRRLVEVTDLVLGRIDEQLRERAEIAQFVHVRYSQQTEARRLLVDSGTDAAGEWDGARLRARFEEAHQREFGYVRSADSVEIIQVTVTVTTDDAAFPRITAHDLERVGDDQSRQVYWGPEHGWLETPILGGRVSLGTDQVAGPLVIEEADTSIAVPPVWSAAIGDVGVVLLTRRDDPTPRTMSHTTSTIERV